MGWSADLLASWLAGATYADWDFSVTDRLFQESTGQTSVASNGDRIGFIIDGAQLGGKTLAEVLAGQTNLALPLNFTTGWTEAGGSNSAVSVNSFTRSATGGLYKTLVEVGKTYEVLADVTASAGWGLVNTPGANGVAVFSSNTLPSGSYRAVWKAVDASLYFRLSTAGSLTVNSFSVKEIPGNHASQSSIGARLTYTVTGQRKTGVADGADDNLLSAYLAGAGANTVIIDADVPLTLAANQMVFGLSGSSTARLRFGFDTAGRLCGGVGSDTETTIVGSTDWRGQRCVAALTIDATTVKLLAAAEEYSGAQNGNPSTTIPARVCSYNNNGTAALPFGGGVKRVISARKAIGLTTFRGIRNQLLAA